MVNVWASWCVPCHAEAPLMVQLAEDKELQMVGINYKDAADNARRFLGRYGNPFAIVGVVDGQRPRPRSNGASTACPKPSSSAATAHRRKAGRRHYAREHRKHPQARHRQGPRSGAGGGVVTPRAAA